MVILNSPEFTNVLVCEHPGNERNGFTSHPVNRLEKIGLTLRRPQNIMGAKPSEQTNFTLHLEGKAVTFGDPAFPNVSRILHFFDIQGWMTLVVQKKIQFLVNGLLKLVWKRTVIPYETVGEHKLHNGWFFKAFKASEALNGPTTLPSAISLSASVSLSCHSFVKKYSWSG
jgi:predicted double-glycine peptidase